MGWMVGNSISDRNTRFFSSPEHKDGSTAHLSSYMMGTGHCFTWNKTAGL